MVRPDGVTVTYKYDAFGRRVQRTPSSGVSTSYIYDGQEVVKDLNSDGSTVEYLNGVGIDNKVRQESSTAGVHYYQVDHLGSTRALTDASGNVVERVSYDSFGNGTGSVRTRYGYTGRERDELTGLYYYRARWYDAQVGRFISEDPIGFNGRDVNLYVYVRNNPVNLIDPEGTQVRSDRDRPGDYYPGMREPYQPQRGGSIACALDGYNPWLSIEPGGGVHVPAFPGLFGSVGMMINPFTLEICFYTKVATRIGAGVFAGVGLKLGLNLGPANGENAKGENFPEIAADATGEVGGGGSVSLKGLGINVKPTAGWGLSAGVDLPVTINIKCYNSPKCNCSK